MLLVVVLGLLAALVLAVSASLQQRAARLAGAAHDHHGDRPRGRLLGVLPILGLARSLARSRIWVYGQLTNVLGVLIQGAALHLGSVAVVQPLIATELFFALPLGSVWTRRWPSLRDWFSGGAIVAGIALFLSVREATPLEGRADRAKVLIASLSVIVFVALIVAVAANRGAATYAALLAVAGGLCSATSAVFMKLTSEDLVGAASRPLPWTGRGTPWHCPRCARSCSGSRRSRRVRSLPRSRPGPPPIRSPAACSGSWHSTSRRRTAWPRSPPWR
jgi:uncharacterized membrane protein YbaN (DUF454 family)